MSFRIATVKYLNALPFLYALNELERQQRIELTEALPAVCSELLLADKVDVALIPIGAISDYEQLFLISDYCISCDGLVRTVKLFSDYPVDQIQQIVLDISSRSSNLLVQVLCKYHWKNHDVNFVSFENQDTALKSGFVKIGDDVFDLENKYEFEYDLGYEWKLMTGLPFVFAVWVSKHPVQPQLITMLNHSFKESLLKIPAIVEDHKAIDKAKLGEYFEKNIFYHLDDTRKNGILKFIELAGIRNPIVDLI